MVIKISISMVALGSSGARGATGSGYHEYAATPEQVDLVSLSGGKGRARNYPFHGFGRLFRG